MTIISSRFAVELHLSGLPPFRSVYISGSIPELGLWCEERGREMEIVSQNESIFLIRFDSFIEYFQFRFFLIDNFGGYSRDLRRSFSIPDTLLGDIELSSAGKIMVKMESVWGQANSRISIFIPEEPIKSITGINEEYLKNILLKVREIGKLKDDLRAEIETLKSTQRSVEQTTSDLPYAKMVRDLLYEINELKGKVKVIARIRPLIEGETQPFFYSINNNPTPSIILNGKRDFYFDDVFDEKIDNENFFELSKIKSIIESSVLISNNVCVFSYGQTNSGKTHTVLGSRGEPGLVELALESVMRVMANHGLEKIIEIEMVEIYRENVFVLIEKCEVTSLNHTIELLHNRIRQERATASTNLNNTSSRSHCIIAISITDDEDSSEGQTSSIFIVDLAGSERIKISGAEGDRLAEANSINKSLSTLGLVLNSLLHKRPFVPYRDSKLTKLLAPVFTVSDPPSKVVMIANLSPALVDERETISTLQFAQRVGDIELRENVESVLEIQEKEEALNRVIQKQRSEIDLLKQRQKIV